MNWKGAMVAVTLACAALPAHGDEILVGAASSLTNAFKEVAVRFQQEHPGTKVLMSFAGSDTVAQQVLRGAPIDVFASADQLAMDTVRKAGMVHGEGRAFAGNEVVLIVSASGPSRISALSDLNDASVSRVAIGNPATVPAGRYARAGLEAAGYWDAVKRREILGQNVRQVLDYVARGEVDAGLVFASDALALREQVKVVAHLPSPVPIRYPVALVERPGRPPQAAAFVDFLLSEQGRRVLEKHGFSAP